MTDLEAFLELLERLAATHGKPVLMSEEELGEWPPVALAALRAQRLLARATPAASTICPGCEQQCSMQVHTPPAGTGRSTSFIVCDKRDDINRVIVPSERLKQWRCSPEAVCEFVAQSLKMRSGSHSPVSTGLWKIGLASGKKRNQMLCLRAINDLELVAGDSAVPLADLVRYAPVGYSVDSVRVGELVDAATTGDDRYTPSNVQRETRKSATQTLHESWRKSYRALKLRRPGMSDVWYSKEIAKTDIAQSRDAETIRKHLKLQK